jgi:hypothetical protein
MTDGQLAVIVTEAETGLSERTRKPGASMTATNRSETCAVCRTSRTHKAIEITLMHKLGEFALEVKRLLAFGTCPVSKTSEIDRDRLVVFQR